MADWRKKGADGNVDSGPGSKGGKGGGAARGPSVTAVDGGKGGDAGSATEKTHNVEFAKGGNTPMFGKGDRTITAPKDAAGSKRPGDTDAGNTSDSGSKFAAGGSGKMFGYTGALPAEAGKTSAR